LLKRFEMRLGGSYKQMTHVKIANAWLQITYTLLAQDTNTIFDMLASTKLASSQRRM